MVLKVTFILNTLSTKSSKHCFRYPVSLNPSMNASVHVDGDKRVRCDHCARQTVEPTH